VFLFWKLFEVVYSHLVFYSGSYLKGTLAPMTTHRAQVLNYKKLGSKAPWITKISAGLLTRRVTQTMGWGQGF
jgi:hypothetical protein